MFEDGYLSAGLDVGFLFSGGLDEDELFVVNKGISVVVFGSFSGGGGAAVEKSERLTVSYLFLYLT